jgi:hypothetical protein
MAPATLSKTISAIVERSGAVRVPLHGGSLALTRGVDGRYYLVERLEDAPKGVKPRDSDGRRLAPGHVLTPEEAERAVRTLLGLDEKAPRRRVGRVRLYTDV